MRPRILGVKQIGYAQELLCCNKAFIRKNHISLFLINFVVIFRVVFVRFASQGCCHLGGSQILFTGTLHLTRNNERCTRFVNQHRVHFIDNAVVKRALHHIDHRRCHIVAQVVKPQFAVGGIGDVAGVVFLTIGRSHALLNQPHAQAQKSDAPAPSIRHRARAR